MSGGLTQFSAYDAQNMYINPISNNITNTIGVYSTNPTYASLSENSVIETVHMEMNITNGTFACTQEINRNCDKLVVKSILFTTKESTEINTFKELLKDTLFELDVGENIMYKLPFSLLTEIEPIQKDNNNITVYIPYYFMKELLVVALDQNIIKVALTNINLHLFSNISITTDNTHMSPHGHYILKNCCFEQFIHQLQTQSILFPEPDSNNVAHINTVLHFNHCVKGYFIECNKLDSISNILLQLNGHDRYRYDKTMLHTIGYRISDNLIYLPFVNKNNYKDISRQSFVGSCNHTRIDGVRLIIKFTNITNTVSLKIHALNFNILRYHSGMSGIAFNT